MSLRTRVNRLFRGTKSPSASSGEPGPATSQEFAVIGLGTFGRNLALRLTELGFTVLGIDSNSGVVQSLADSLGAALVLDATNEDALRQADIESYPTAIVAIGGSHFEAAALTTIALAKIGIPRILAVGDSRRQAEILEAIGATRVLNPVAESALALANELTDPGRGDTWPVTPSQELALVPVPAELAGQTVGDCDRLGVSVLLIARDDQVTPHPPPAFELRHHDMLVVHGSPIQILNFRRIA